MIKEWVGGAVVLHKHLGDPWCWIVSLPNSADHLLPHQRCSSVVQNTERTDHLLIGALKQFPLDYTFNIVFKGSQVKTQVQP